VRLTFRQSHCQGLMAVAAISSLRVLCGCGSTPSPSAAAAPSCATPGPNGLDVACPGVADSASQQALDSLHLEGDGRTLLLGYLRGPGPAPTAAHPYSCGFLTGVRVSESKSAVRVTVMLGRRGPSGCSLGGSFAATTVRLQDPLGSRPVYDGGAGATPVAVTR
jgi:hypothetical protein